ncbi:30S ribosomal protein S9 [candidate division WOR-3 bacterium]|nr:30S ribosomal protein S9 [candidate division WOR-3 bacterium]
MEQIIAIGRRKRATAQVILREGKGNITVNGKNPKDYFGRDDFLKYIELPFHTIKSDIQFDAIVTVNGGGLSGQAGALALGIARALLRVNPEFRKSLKSKGLLKRDPREKERKKYGKAKARKSFQWTKR